MIKKLAWGLLFAAVSFGFITILTHTPVIMSVEKVIYDSLFWLRDPDPELDNPYASDRLILEAFDEESLAYIGKWPWKRYVHARYLNKIQKFSPGRVFFDVLFVDSEKMPEYITENLKVEDDVARKLSSVYENMDGELSTALAKYDNVYLDLQLVDRERGSLPPEFLARIARNEDRLRQFDLPAAGLESDIKFSSLEPILDGFVSNTIPTVINVFRDFDGKVRRWPLYYTYTDHEGTNRNVMTIVLQCLKDYYHLSREDIVIEQDAIVLRNACIPEKDIRNHERERVMLASNLMANVINPGCPAGYQYNTNLYRCVKRLWAMDPVADMPSKYPLRVRKLPDGKFKVLDTWEVLDAVRDSGMSKISLVEYTATDIRLPLQFCGTFLINFAGSEGISTDDKTGQRHQVRRFQTEGYHTVYNMPDYPDLPEVDKDGKVKDRQGYDIAGLEKWFLGYCEARAMETEAMAADEIGEKVNDPAVFLGFLAKDQKKNRWFYYYQFLKSSGVPAGKFTEAYASYPQFAAEAGQAAKYHLSEAVLTEAVYGAYEQGFDKYLEKYVFSGGTFLGLGDVHSTPCGTLPGISVIINALSTVITGNMISRSLDIPWLDIKLLGLICLLITMVYMFSGVRVSWVCLFASLVAIGGLSFYLFVTKNFVLTTSPLLAGSLVSFINIFAFKLATEQKDKKFLHRTFGAYLAPEVIDEMVRKREMPELGGESRVITAYFTDIAGFSTFSEKLSPHDILELLNDYMSNMTNILIHDKGTLDKYIGDAIVAFFNAPKEVKDHPLRACAVALRMQERLAELRDKWSKEQDVPASVQARNIKKLGPQEWHPDAKWPEIVHNMRMRIGVNTGEVVVGNLGCEIRMNYTMMGDPVNLAARLEAASKQYGVFILASEMAVNAEFPDEVGAIHKVGDFIDMRAIDKMVVVGRSEPVEVFELMAFKDKTTEAQKELIKLFHEGKSLYFAMEWDKAIECFERSYKLEQYPDQKTNPSKVFIERCRRFKETPPVAKGAKWDGVYKLTSK